MKVTFKQGDPLGEPPVRHDFVVIEHSDEEVIAYVHYPTDGREPYLVVEVEHGATEVADETGNWQEPAGDLDEPALGLKPYWPDAALDKIRDMPDPDDDALDQISEALGGPWTAPGALLASILSIVRSTGREPDARHRADARDAELGSQ